MSKLDPEGVVAKTIDLVELIVRKERNVPELSALTGRDTVTIMRIVRDLEERELVVSLGKMPGRNGVPTESFRWSKCQQ